MTGPKLHLHQRFLGAAGEEMNQVDRIARWLHADVVGRNLHVLFAYGLADEIERMENHGLGLFDAGSNRCFEAHSQDRTIGVGEDLCSQMRCHDQQDNR